MSLVMANDETQQEGLTARHPLAKALPSALAEPVPFMANPPPPLAPAMGRLSDANLGVSPGGPNRRLQPCGWHDPSRTRFSGYLGTNLALIDTEVVTQV